MTSQPVKLPVFRLSHDAAVQELEAILDSKPDDDAILDLIHWHRDNDTRIDELNSWIIMAPDHGVLPGPVAAPVQAPPEPVNTPPASKIPELLEKLEVHIRKCATAASRFAFEQERQRVNMCRYKIRHESDYKETMEPLPNIPDDLWNTKKNRTEVQVAPRTPAELAKDLRKDMWKLLAAIEEMPSSDRRELLKNVELIQAQAMEALALINEYPTETPNGPETA